MSETKNYARHVGDRGWGIKPTGKHVFFEDTPPMPEHEYHQWAFFRIPSGYARTKFKGRLVYEDNSERNIRLAIDN